MQAIRGASTSMPCSCSECRQNAGKAPIQCRCTADTVLASRHSVQIPRRKSQGGNRPRVCRRCASFRKSIRCASCRRYHLPPLVWYRSGSRMPCIMCRQSGCSAGIGQAVPPEQCRQNPRCYRCRCFAGSGSGSSSSLPAGQGGRMQAPAAAGIGKIQNHAHKKRRPVLMIGRFYRCFIAHDTGYRAKYRGCKCHDSAK